MCANASHKVPPPLAVPSLVAPQRLPTVGNPTGTTSLSLSLLSLKLPPNFSLAYVCVLLLSSIRFIVAVQQSRESGLGAYLLALRWPSQLSYLGLC